MTTSDTSKTEMDTTKPASTMAAGRGIGNTYSYGIAIGIALAIGGFEMAWNVHARNTAMTMAGITISVDGSGCTPSALKMRSGTATYNIVNRSAQPLDWQILRDGEVVAGQTSIAPGTAAAVTQEMIAGDYQLICGSTAAPKGEIEVLPVTIIQR
ncbi:hypothetical protein SAMN05877809_10173 [Rhodobacter sp. JA431]|uniref:cupredoxin domain-containing protein n=1 Tax=Rhodobacter sp. JA431 TaxID=570013 RepID=UPI000BC9CAF2|nr:cupredoxin domain-containing protein [Rhodobacter sp. JA431]SOB89786.1 hypothetical protein SAMN05877809_10173 [Rhodobacter sp. JA431]